MHLNYSTYNSRLCANQSTLTLADLRMKFTVLTFPATLVCAGNHRKEQNITVADFLNDHPGGAESIMLVAGEDATEDFMAIQSSDARKQLDNFHIGTLLEGY